ncbi:hypothetical protein LZ009_10700 [Ramlibacter sp. XY19]|uniref:hypothetical protein n=1 Tax=Ramlibacter paludis TaxID=2908000 RepID=UPI0023DBEE23|nr:hypothetical protein [Ramlibacter paludis]MCG2593250.1 hypothetical protein [Ramlibacter paludis]
MTVLASPRFLRAVLWADAASCAGTALLQLAGTAVLAPLLGLPAGLLQGSAALLCVVAPFAAWLARRDPPWCAGVLFLAAGNALWVLVCLALLFTGAAGTAAGQAWLVIQAVAVGVLAELEFMAVRRRASGMLVNP